MHNLVNFNRGLLLKCQCTFHRRRVEALAPRPALGLSGIYAIRFPLFWGIGVVVLLLNRPKMATSRSQFTLGELLFGVVVSTTPALDDPLVRSCINDKIGKLCSSRVKTSF